MKIGPCMRYARQLASDGGIAIIDAARRVGPHGSLCYGYASVNRAIKAGIVKVAPPLPGRRGRTIVAA